MPNNFVIKAFFIILFFVPCAMELHAQRGVIRDIGSRVQAPISGGGGSGVSDSLRKRDKFEDSITVKYRLLDSSRYFRMDTSINDYYSRFPIPYTHHYLGNPGTATKSILFVPTGRAGWDPGFHSFDVYKWNVHQARFFNTTRPYTEMAYTLGSQLQQFIEVLHTQNIKPSWNASFNYSLLNSPGFYKNQKTVHNNYALTSWYESVNKRYSNFFVITANRLQSGENGGIQNAQDLKNPIYDDRFSVPVKLGNNVGFSTDPFSTVINTGTKYSAFSALMRQHYDFGKKDSIVTDSTVIPLFYPRLRFEHTINYSEYKYRFVDQSPDTLFYESQYNIVLDTPVTKFQLRDKWNELKNDFSIYQFPDAKNLQQFIRVGASMQHIKGSLRDTFSFVNTSLNGEYRNRTRNQKWDMNASGVFYLTGYNRGDYHALIKLHRVLSSRLGSLSAGFENINREPSFVFDERSNFYLDAAKSFSKENISHIFGSASNPILRLQLGADYYMITNFMYFRDLYKPEQYNDVFSLLRVYALKTFKFGKSWNLHSEVHLQQKAGNAALNVPLVFTRNRFQYEGNFGYPNLRAAFGLEVRYHTPFKADHYAPLIGQFSYQDTTTINNRPDIHAFFHFRIRNFKAYMRAENLNTLRYNDDGLAFRRYNFAAPEYPYPALVLRLGIYWSFVN